MTIVMPRGPVLCIGGTKYPHCNCNDDDSNQQVCSEKLVVHTCSRCSTAHLWFAKPYLGPSVGITVSLNGSCSICQSNSVSSSLTSSCSLTASESALTNASCHVSFILADTYIYLLGMWRSQPISAPVGCGFYVQNPSDSDADLLRDQNYQPF